MINGLASFQREQDDNQGWQVKTIKEQVWALCKEELKQSHLLQHRTEALGRQENCPNTGWITMWQRCEHQLWRI